MEVNKEKAKSISKFLSLVLRHRPESIGIALDAEGWTDIDALIAAANKSGRALTRTMLDEIVATNDKRRFAISEDGTRIRANQGHSVSVELGYEPAEPPEILLHGTVAKVLDSIRREGLKKMKRHHVHLHEDLATATAVGARRGKPVLLRVLARQMHKAGHVFHLTENRVWLVDAVSPEFIEFPGETATKP